MKNTQRAKRWYWILRRDGVQYEEDFKALMAEKGVTVERRGGRIYRIWTDIATAHEIDREAFWIEFKKDPNGQYFTESKGA